MRSATISALAAAVILTTSASTALANENSLSNKQLQMLITRIVNQRTQKLQSEVNHLQNKVHVLQTELNTQATKSLVKDHYPSIISMPQEEKMVPHLRKGHMPTIGNAKNKHGNYVQPQQISHSQRHYQAKTQNEIPRMTGASTPSNPRYKHITVNRSHKTAANSALNSLYLGGTSVYTSPYIGIHSAYDGSNLIINAPDVNLDARLLKQRQAMDDALAKAGLALPKHPIVVVSGELEGAATLSKLDNRDSHADVNLTDASLETFVQISHWITGFIDLEYDPTQLGPYRVSNSNVAINKGFITIGNFSSSPFYASIGQMFVPFGQYTSYFITDPLTELSFETKGRAFSLGLYPMKETGFYAAGYVFRSNTRADRRFNGGINMGFKTIHGHLHTDLAIGAINNIADAVGMQETAAPTNIPFSGFSSSEQAEDLSHAVPGLDVHGDIDFKAYTMLFEYDTALRSFAPQDMSYNGRGAKVQAFDIQGIYNFVLHGKPGSFGISYGFSKDALALLLPEDRYMAVINYSFWRDTLLSLEYRYSDNYSSNDTASGAGSTTFRPTYNHANTITAQLAVYF